MRTVFQVQDQGKQKALEHQPQCLTAIIPFSTRSMCTRAQQKNRKYPRHKKNAKSLHELVRVLIES